MQTANEQAAELLTEQIDAKLIEKNTAFWDGFHAHIANDVTAQIEADQRKADLTHEIDILKARRRAFIVRGERCGHELATATE